MKVIKALVLAFWIITLINLIGSCMTMNAVNDITYYML